ncbi:hypothetical protein EYF80_021359 [Liparis tanakae]|uniref:Uncharacterized protein n=1 Tax=Liparis tanakae TaxID=230148 RepID=A0A4Z2HRR2_9TELE|nr:hypothetical protein EYF80_021359 [Liparis tanakae]
MQGAGKSWVGVLPSSNLGLTGREEADVEKLGEMLRLRMGVLPLLLLVEPSPLMFLGDEPPRCSLIRPYLFIVKLPSTNNSKNSIVSAINAMKDTNMATNAQMVQ